MTDPHDDGAYSAEDFKFGKDETPKITEIGGIPLKHLGDKTDLPVTVQQGKGIGPALRHARQEKKYRATFIDRSGVPTFVRKFMDFFGDQNA